MSNKLTTQGYFIRRLRDSGYIVNRLYDKYGEADPRQWTIIIDPAVASVFCTCYTQFHPETGEESFWELYDGGQFIPTRVRLKTESIEVILQYLHKFNIINKKQGYGITPQTSEEKE